MIRLASLFPAPLLLISMAVCAQTDSKSTLITNTKQNLFRRPVIVYPNLDRLKNISKQTIEKIDQLAQQIQANLVCVRESNERYKGIRFEAMKLNDEKNRLIEEIKNGEICSKCKARKSEMGDKAFYDHIRDVNAQAIQLTQEEMDKLIEEMTAPIDAKLKENDNRQQVLQGRYDDCDSKLKQNWKQMQNAAQIWQMIYSLRKTTIKAQQLDRYELNKNAFDRSEKHLQAVEKGREQLAKFGPIEVETLKALEKARITAAKEKEEIQQRMELQEGYDKSENAEFERDSLDEYHHLLGAVAKTDDTKLYYGIGVLPKITVSTEMASISIGPGQMLWSIKAGDGVSINMEVTSSNYSMEIRGYFELLGKLQVGMRRRQTVVQDGSEIEDEPFIDLQKDDPNVEIKLAPKIENVKDKELLIP
jgi:hypothetical protein